MTPGVARGTATLSSTPRPPAALPPPTQILTPTVPTAPGGAVPVPPSLLAQVAQATRGLLPAPGTGVFGVGATQPGGVGSPTFIPAGGGLFAPGRRTTPAPAFTPPPRDIAGDYAPAPAPLSTPPWDTPAAHAKAQGMLDRQAGNYAAVQQLLAERAARTPTTGGGAEGGGGGGNGGGGGGGDSGGGASAPAPAPGLPPSLPVPTLPTVTFEQMQAALPTLLPGQIYEAAPDVDAYFGANPEFYNAFVQVLQALGGQAIAGAVGASGLATDFILPLSRSLTRKAWALLQSMRPDLAAMLLSVFGRLFGMEQVFAPGQLTPSTQQPFTPQSLLTPAIPMTGAVTPIAPAFTPPPALPILVPGVNHGA